ncbi:putative surface anchored protein [Sporosarcina luteola]|nr:putative surface anchored protein [Sporosarcina luteola]
MKTSAQDGKISAEATINLTYSWSLNEDASEDKTYNFPFPEQLEAIESSGELHSVGTYQITGSQLVVSINENATSQSNILSIPAKIKPEATEFQFGNETYVVEESNTITTAESSDSGEGTDIEDPSSNENGEEQEQGDGQTNPDESDTPTPGDDAGEQKPGDDEGNSEGEDTPKPEDDKIDGEQPEDGNKTDEDKVPQPGESIIAENILTGAIVTVFEDEFSDVPVNGVTKTSIIQVDYQFAFLNNHGYKKGATFNFTLPRELVVFNSIEKKLIFNGEEAGTFTVDTSGNASIVFTDFIENNSNVSGTLEVQTRIDETTTINEEKVVTFTPIEGGETVTLPILFEHSGSTIDKRGIANKSYNADSIEWTVDFNKGLDTVGNAVLQDFIQDGMELEEGSVEVYKLITRLDGTVEKGEIADFSIKQEPDFSIDLGTITSAYRLIYKTRITDSDQTKFVNTAVLTGQGIPDSEATATVTFKRGTPLEKNFVDYDPSTQTITWEIKYNYNEKRIPQAEAVLEDVFNKTQQLVEESLKVEKMAIDEEGQDSVDGVTDNYSLTDKGNGEFTLQFDEDIKNAYKITYQTKAINRVFDTEEIKNKVTANEKEATAKGSIHQQILYKKHLEEDTNYNTKTTKWRITLNYDSYKMENVVLEDLFTNKGLNLLPETLVITSRGTKLNPDVDYVLRNKEGLGFEIEFLKVIIDPHDIEFETEFNYDARTDKSKKYLENLATLSWKVDGDDKSISSSDQFEPDSYTKSNGFKSGSYNAINKDITWSIGINYNLGTLSSASVEDDILGNQHFVENSINVYEMELTGSANGVKKKQLVEHEGYELHFERDEGEIKRFKVVFKEKNTTKPYLIEYKTSLAVQQIQPTYNNTATLYDSETQITDLEASVSIPNGGHYAGKTGKQNDRIIDWTVPINYSQSTISNFRLIDTPSENQFILDDSFIVFTTTVEEDGKVVKGEELSKGAYEVLLNKNEDESITSFELVFNNKIDSPYILEYKSIIFAKPGDHVTNSLAYKGEEIEEGTIQKPASVKVARSTGDGSIKGYVGKLTVIKVDKDNQEKVLQGAEFSLLDLLTEKVVQTGKTDENGKVTFEDLLYGQYVLKETGAPAGYLFNVEDETEVAITGEKELTVTNEKATQAVELKKVDSDDAEKTLAGATFDLYKKGDNEDYYVLKKDLKTNERGIIQLNELEPGEYQFVETIAPAGYELDSTPVSFTIHKNKDSIVKVTKENERSKGKLTVIKVDAADGSLLEGATFNLVDGEDNVIRTGTTNEIGELLFEDIPHDEYTLIEVEAPNGYVWNRSKEK